MTKEFVTLSREVLEQTLEAFEHAGLWEQQQTMEALSDALEQQGGRESVAEHELKDVRCECCGYMTHQREHMGCIRAVQPMRKPLSYEKIRKAWNDAEGCRYGYEHFARAVELAHNIK